MNPNYRNFRLNKLNTPEFRHVWLLLFWPAFGIIFYSLERFIPLDFKPIYCPLDDMIPFNEFFLIPYLYWFIFIFWIIIYSFFFDVPTFKKYMYYLMVTYTITCIIYILYPNKQELRPTEFVRDNFFVTFMKGFYKFDTNTNVCPSLHVVGSFAVAFAAWNSKRYSTVFWRIFFMVSAVWISSSTVFLKQHSIIDVIVALILCFAAYPIVFMRKKKDCSDDTKPPETEPQRQETTV